MILEFDYSLLLSDPLSLITYSLLMLVLVSSWMTTNLKISMGLFLVSIIFAMVAGRGSPP